MANIGEKEKALRALRDHPPGRDLSTIEAIRAYAAKGKPVVDPVCLILSPQAETDLLSRPSKPKRDRRAYQRELMRKRRAASKGSKA